MKKIHIVILLTTIIMALFFFWLVRDVFTTENPPAVFRMSNKILYDKLLLIRRNAPNGNLLLKILNEKTVFQYDIDKKIASEIDERNWNEATEKISICQGTVGVGEENENGKYNTYGKYALAANISPNKTKIAVISAYGPKGPNFGLMPFMGSGGKIWGTRYLELKENTATYPTVRKPIRLREMISPSLCWAEDENLVVIYDSWDYSFSVANFSSQPAMVNTQNTNEQLAPKPDLSRLTGVVRDYGIDQNGDGLFEKVAVEVETETTVPGRYKISVGLRSDGDRYFGEGVETQLKGGVETTKLLFDANKWFDEKIDGVFKINYVQLYYGDYPFLEMRENVGQTREYKLSQFERPNIIFTGENTVAPIDKNRNGKYEGLQIQVIVDVLYAGDYKFSGALYDEFSDVTAKGLVEFGDDGETSLKKGKGTITFYFSGKKIIEHGVSGKFRLRNAYIYNEKQSTSLQDNLIKTTAFDVNQFESEN